MSLFYNIQTVNTVVLCHILNLWKTHTHKLEKCVDSVEKIPHFSLKSNTHFYISVDLN